MNWLNYPPHNDFQLSTDFKCDDEACLSYSLVHCLEPILKLFGDLQSYNPQYLAISSKTMKDGNTEPNVDYAFYQYGLIPTSVMPELTQFTWNQLYGQNVNPFITQAQEFNKKYDVTIEAINASKALAISEQSTFTNPYTVWVIVDLNRGLGSPIYHGQALLNANIWDSYPTNPKLPNNPIIWAYKVSLIPKNMSNALLVKKGTEYGFYLPATGEAAMIDKANNLGYPLPVLNNGANVDWANVKPDITTS